MKVQLFLVRVDRFKSCHSNLW